MAKNEKKNVTSKTKTNSKPKMTENAKKTKKVETKIVETEKIEKVEAEKVEAKKIESAKNVKKGKEVEETFENDSKLKTTLKRIWNVVFWCAFFILLFIWIFDFYKVTKDQEPVFCVKTVEHKYDDGKTTECVGLGYKVYTYERKSINMSKQFTPFFVGMEE